MFEIQRPTPSSPDANSHFPFIHNAVPAIPARARLALPPPSRDSASGAAFILNALRRWWRWVLPAGLVLAPARRPSFIVCSCRFTKPSAGCASNSHQQYIAFESKAEDRESNRMFVNTQIALLRNPIILGPVLEDPQIARLPEINAQTDPLQWLARQISVKQEGDSELYRVTYASPSPQAAARVVNAIVNEYFHFSDNEATQQNQGVVDKLLKDQKFRKVGLKQLSETVRDLAKQATGRDPFAGNLEPVTIMNHPMADIQKHLIESEVEQAVLNARIKVLEETPARPVNLADADIPAKVEAHPEVMRLKLELMEMHSQLRSLGRGRGAQGKDPARQQLRGKSPRRKRNSSACERMPARPSAKSCNRPSLPSTTNECLPCRATWKASGLRPTCCGKSTRANLRA